jgi:hypothetical protein
MPKTVKFYTLFFEALRIEMHNLVILDRLAKLSVLRQINMIFVQMVVLESVVPEHFYMENLFI